MRFYGSNKDGKLIIQNRQNLIDYLNSLDGDFEIKVTPTKDIRTLKMNNLYWKWLSILSTETGYTKNELHNYFKMKLLCEEDEINGEKFYNCPSTGDLTIKEFSDYLINVGRLGLETFNCYLPHDSPL